MLLAGQIENSSNTYLTVQRSAVSSWCFYSSGFNYKADNSKKYSEKDKTPDFTKVVAKISKLYAGVRWHKPLCNTAETTLSHISGIHYIKDSKNVEGFHDITEFPDKLS